MTIADWLMIAAVLLGPIIAVRLTRYLDNNKEVRGRKLWVFTTLMATRASVLSPIHVEALNRIDLEFNPKIKEEKNVIDAWKAYLDLLNDKTLPADQWGMRRVDLLVELLHTMAHVLDYEFDKTTIKNSCYFPRGHGQVAEDQDALRQWIREVIADKRGIPMFLTNVPPIPPREPLPVELAPQPKR